MRIAITTKDGLEVNQHFGKADRFYIYDIKNNALVFVEIRFVYSYCENINGVSVDPGHKFAVDKLSKIYKQISDCEAIYTQKIGEKPLQAIEEKGISVKLCNCSVQSILGCNGTVSD
jgi:predicted Fe-Mo cluster-binding NifX family protein